MKKVTLVFSLLIAIPFGMQDLLSQCTPDPSCEDVGEPGQYCPEDFPPVVLDQPYDQTMTFILPAREYDVGGTIYTLDSVALDSVKNIPPGMSYYVNSAGFASGKAYCSQLTGTPTEAGTYYIELYLRAFATPEGGDSFEVGAFVDDTSLVVTVEDYSAVREIDIRDFQALATLPNPYSDRTRIRFYTPVDDRVNLQVYSILGELMHEELYTASEGEHSFNFDGSELHPGTYFYRISNNRKLFTGKIIKTR